MHKPDLAGSDVAPPRTEWISWSSLWLGWTLAVCVTLALSTQLLFEFDLYENWSLADILLGWLDHLLDQFVVGVCIFVAIALSLLVPGLASHGRLTLLFVAVTTGALAGESALLLRTAPVPGISTIAILIARLLHWWVISGLTCAIFVYRRQGLDAAQLTHEAELQRIAIDRQLIEAQLQSLRAQIEPHFLFNTLANVRQLYRTEPERGRTMLRNFVVYLRAALPQMREHETTLTQEVALARAYLDVLQVRMGKRLSVRVDIPERLAESAFPPLALSTLTENAIKHGLNPLPEGGEVTITASATEDTLEVSVSDTGAGFRASSGTGSGLANLRARLHALYGKAGRLAFEANAPRGIRATMTIPLTRTAVKAT